MESDNPLKNMDSDYLDPSFDNKIDTTDTCSNHQTETTDIGLNDCKSLIIRKCSTGIDLPPKVNLYSENILKEEETTDTVDRGSIADLVAIKKHWEARFESEETDNVPVKKAQRVVRHWSVKLPNIPGKPNNKTDTANLEVVNRNNQDTMNINDDYNENESAIEREIRWAMEREEMLRQEHEQRQILREKMAMKKEQEEMVKAQLNGVQTQQIIEHYENTDKEKFKPTYHEMTEADLGHEIAKKEAIKEFEMRQQNGENQTSDDSVGKMKPTPMHYRETVVQMEIRLQRERDAQFKEQQKLRKQSLPVDNGPATETTNVNNQIVDANDNPPPLHSIEVSESVPSMVTHSEEKPSGYKHIGESKIARELEEAKIREEDFRLQRKKSISELLSAHENSRKNSVDDLEGSVKSLELEENTMNVSSNSDSATPPSTSKSSAFINETPIEREIRLFREREAELRREKGYPTNEKPVAQQSTEAKTDVSRISKYHPKKKNDLKGAAMKKIAASRLQQEIKQERSREETLRESGRINTTSEQWVGENMKYKEVSEGPVKRNFVTMKKNTPAKELPESQLGETESSAKSMSTSQKRNTPNFVIRTPKISTTFSFQEARSNAGSMIEQELKEMREREEELKKQREHLQNQANNNENPE